MSESNQSSKELLAWLWRGYLRKHTSLLAVAVVFMIIEGSMLGALAYMVEPMFDDVFVAGDRGMLFVVGIVLICIFVL